MTNQTVLVLVLTFAGVWALQMWAGGMQARRFMRAVRAIRATGRTAIGSAGGRIGGRVFVALATDPAGRVVAATRLSGRTVFARPRPVPDVVGHELADLRTRAETPLDEAVAEAAGFLLDGTPADQDASPSLG